MNNYNEIIKEAINETYHFNRWRFQNEAEFKHELFHILANKFLKGNCLGCDNRISQVPILHAEARPENKINSKADILICNPKAKIQPLFNYSVEYLLELKYKLNNRNLEKEIKKLDRYSRKFKSIYFISATGNKNSIQNTKIEHHSSKNINIIFPLNQTKEKISNYNPSKLNSIKVYEIVQKCIIKTLNKYGNNKKQYKAYFWCNYEGEQKRGFSYPSEGDFNSFLYNELRLNLPKGIEIRSEYSIKDKDTNTNYRIDLVVSDIDKTFFIPIEVKMNWDQFKLKTNERDSEVFKILRRFELLITKYKGKKIMPFLIVIQGHWRMPTTTKKEDSLYELRKAEINYDFLTFNEEKDKIEFYKHLPK